MSSAPDFPPGLRLLGKWNKRTYQVERFLGEGANSKVYLVLCDQERYAMKVGFSALALQSEINVLQTIGVSSYGEPYLIDADDVQYKGREFPVYVMRYVKGLKMTEYVERYGIGWLAVIGSNLLKKLHQLHRRGWVFGDLNMDNILVTAFGQVELIDYGGATRFGHAVKQFTERYDRGFWGAGSRVAEESYDLFSFAMLCLTCLDQRFAAPGLPQSRNPQQLLDWVNSNPAYRPMQMIFRKAIRGEYGSAEEMHADWKNCINRKQAGLPSPVPTRWLKRAFFISAAALVAMLYLVYY